MGNTTINGDFDIHLGRFTDIQFASDVSYPHTTGTRSPEFAPKEHPSGQVDVDVDVEEVSRHGHEEIELSKL